MSEGDFLGIYQCVPAKSILTQAQLLLGLRVFWESGSKYILITPSRQGYLERKPQDIQAQTGSTFDTYHGSQEPLEPEPSLHGTANHVHPMATWALGPRELQGPVHKKVEAVCGEQQKTER